MKLRVEEIKESPRSLTFHEEIGELNELLGAPKAVDYQFVEAPRVDVTYYRSGEDLFFEGDLEGPVAGTCARCLESYRFSLGRHFSFVLKPSPAAGGQGAAELSDEDLALSFYSGEEVNLSPLVREEMILSLPTRPLCAESCSGLCPRCGTNLNAASCDCREEPGDPRFAAIRALKLPR